MESSCVEVHGPLCAGDVVLLVHEVEQHWAAGRQVVCDVRGVCDLGVVDALARLALASRRHGAWLRVRADSQDAQQLLDLVGLATAVRVEVRGPSPRPPC